MKRLARLLDQPGTTKTIESESSMTIPDEYVREHCRCHAGDVYFVEVWRDGTTMENIWRRFNERKLWRVDVAEVDPLLVFMTGRVNEKEAREVIAKEAQS